MGDRPVSTGSGVLDDVAEVIGDEAALRLARAFGGIELYIPAKVGLHHPITVAIGAVAAAALVAHYHGTEILVPLVAARHRRVRELASTGRLTRQAIARETGYSERHIYNLLRDGDDQPDLFGSPAT